MDFSCDASARPASCLRRLPIRSAFFLTARLISFASLFLLPHLPMGGHCSSQVSVRSTSQSCISLHWQEKLVFGSYDALESRLLLVDPLHCTSSLCSSFSVRSCFSCWSRCPPFVKMSLLLAILQMLALATTSNGIASLFTFVFFACGLQLPQGLSNQTLCPHR